MSKSRIDDRIISNLKEWENSFPAKTIFVNRGKKTKHSLQILASLALLGSSTTRDIAKFIIESTPQYQYSKPRDRDSRKLEKMIREIITGRLRKKTGRKRSQEKYPGLESNHFVRTIETKKNEKNMYVNYYSLDFLGFLFVIGFNFKGKELERFLINAGKYHLFFAYIQKIGENTSYSFVKKIFLKPIYKMISDELITVDTNIDFYLSNIIEGIGKALRQFGEGLEYNDEDDNAEKIKFVKGIKKYTFYDERATSDWPYAMLDIFFPDEDIQEEFIEHAHWGMEINLLYRVMQRVHFVYFGHEGNNIPRQTQRIPTSKRWKDYKKYHQKYKSPRDYDNKRKIRIRYDADFISG